MRVIPRFALGLVAVFLTLCTARAADPVFRPPEVAPDGSVTVRVFAPNAREVALNGLGAGGAKPMVRDAQGVWSATVGPLPADFYSYTFSIDGAVVTDPLNRKIKKWIRSESVVEVPGTPPHFAASQPGPHGLIHRHVFTSRTRQREAAFQVYTPPGFDPRARKKYPVVYLLHGFGDDETAWSEIGHAQFIADNLLAKKSIVPAIIVMTEGHPLPIPLGVRPTDYMARNLAAMQEELLTEVIPQVEKSYPVRADRAHRAIVGLSMGGGQALTIGLTHLETFGWVGGFSSAVPTENLDTRFAALAAAAREKRKLLPAVIWVGCGRDDYLVRQSEAFVSWLETNKIGHTWRPTDGGHTWGNWRAYLAEFLPLLFKP